MRWLFRIVLGLIALGVVALAALLLLPADRIARLAEVRFERATGRALTLGGDVRPTLWPALGVTTGAVEVANAGWSDAGPLLRAQSLSVAVDPLALLRGDLRITGIGAQSPQILLETGPDGRNNWQFDTATDTAPDTTGAEPGQTAGLPAFTLDRAQISDGSLRHIDRRTGTDRHLTALSATLAIPSLQGATTLDLTAAYGDAPLRLSGSIAGLAAFVDGGAVPTVLDLELAGNSVALEGRVGLSPPALTGRISGDIDDLPGLFAALGQPAPALPRGLGRDRIALSATLTYTDATLNLRDVDLGLDDNTLTGAADLTLGGERPRLNARVAAGALDLSGLSAGGADSKDAPPAQGWSRATLDVSALQALDAQVALAAESIDLGVTTLGATDIHATLDEGRAVTEIRRLTAFDGAIDGSVIVNSRGGLSARITLNGSGLSISRLLGETVGNDRLSATGSVAVNLLGVGNSVQALMQSLSGEGRLSTGAGELRGLDLVGMLRNLDPGFVGAGSKTIFDGIAAGFTVTDGVLRNDDLRLDAPFLSATGAGTVGIGARDLDYRLVPRLLDREDISVPVLITGPWAAPNFRLDLDGLARDKLKAEGRRLEERAKAAAQDKLSEELGTPITDGRSVEDALKRKLEEEARRGILNLLGGD